MNKKIAQNKINETNETMFKKTDDALNNSYKSYEETLINILESINLKASNRQVVEVLGENELIFEGGEFFLEETRNPKNRKKISRNGAKEILLDHAIKNKTKRKITNIVKE